jgi:predicted transcriptional regulator
VIELTKKQFELLKVVNRIGGVKRSATSLFRGVITNYSGYFALYYFFEKGLVDLEREKKWLLVTITKKGKKLLMEYENDTTRFKK